METTPFKVDIAQPVLADLRQRISNTRWTDEADNADWKFGTNRDYLQSLLEYWHDGFDWRAQENAINRFAQFRTDVDGTCVHFIHERGRGERCLPLILTHGFPDSFLRFAKIIPLLTDPAAHGGDPDDAFDVIVPSLPGYGFSSKPRQAGMLFKVADLWATLMTRTLGYDRFAAHGGDWGSLVTEHLARSHADALVGIHITDVPFVHLFEKPKNLSLKEKKLIEQTQQWTQRGGSYALIQGSSPQSLAYGLNDSPAGLAAWMVDKFRAWSDCDGELDSAFSKDELLTNITLYWVTRTIDSSFRFYSDVANASALRWITELLKKWTCSSKVPTGFARFPHDIHPPPREWAERFYNLRHWTEMPRGGHFGAMEQPELLAADIRAFFRPLRTP